MTAHTLLMECISELDRAMSDVMMVQDKSASVSIHRACCCLLTQLARLGFASDMRQQQGIWAAASQRISKMPDAMLPLIKEAFHPAKSGGPASSCNTDLLKAVLVGSQSLSVKISLQCHNSLGQSSFIWLPPQ